MLVLSRTDEGMFRLCDHEQFLAANGPSIEAFRTRRAGALAAERWAWAAAGEFAPSAAGDGAVA